jgi:hypothetical protein
VLAGYAANYGLALNLNGTTRTTVDLNKNASAATVQTALNDALGGSAAALVSQSASAQAPQVDMVALSGSFVLGDMVRINGLSASNLAYTVSKNDLSADGKGSGTGTAEQVLANVAAKLRTAINSAGHCLVSASGTGGLLILTAIKSGMEGAFKLSGGTIRRTGSTATVSGTQAATTNYKQVSGLNLSGDFRVGNEIRLDGLASEQLVYQVVAADLLSNGQVATQAQALQNIAAKLSVVIASAVGLKVDVVAIGAQLWLSAKTAGDAGKFVPTLSLVALNRDIVSVVEDAASTRWQVDTLQLSATKLPKSGDVITLKGIAAKDVFYGVSDMDLTANGRGGGGAASIDQALTNIGRRLVDAISQAGGRKVWASSQGGVVTLVATVGGSAGSYTLSSSVSLKSDSDLAVKASGAATSSKVQRDTLQLNGSFELGELIQVDIAGAATAKLAYEVVANDLTADGLGGGGTATAAQSAVNIAKKVGALMNAQATLTSKFKIEVQGSLVSITSKTTGYCFTLRANTSGQGWVLGTEPGSSSYRVSFGGALAGLDVGALVVKPSANAGVNNATVKVVETVKGGSHETLSARLLVIGGSKIAARVATGSDDSAIGFEATGLDFGLVLASASNPADTRSWMTLKGSAASMGLIGTDSLGLTLTASNSKLSLNTGLGQDSAGLANTSTIDWGGSTTAASNLVLHPSTGTTVTLDAQGTVLEASGTMDVAFGDLFSASGTLVVSRQQMDVTVGRDPMQTTGLLIGGSNVSASVRGVAVTGLQFGMALLRPADANDTDQRSWLALQADVASVTLDAAALGLPSSLVVKADKLHLDLNLGLGQQAGVANDAVLDLSPLRSGRSVTDRSIAVRTGDAAGAEVVLDLGASGQALVAMSADATIQIGDLVSLTGSLGFSHTGTRLVTLDSGERRLMDATLIAADDVTVRMGPGAASDANFFGVELSGASMGLVVLKDLAGGGSFIGLKAGAGAVGLKGIDGLTLESNDLAITVNTGPSAGVLSGRVVDFTRGDIDGNGVASLSTPVALAGSAQAVHTLDMAESILIAEGGLKVGLSHAAINSGQSFFDGSGMFRLEVAGGQLLLAGTQLQAQIRVGTYSAGVNGGSFGLVLDKDGSGKSRMALALDATVNLSVPGLVGVSLYGDVSLALNAGHMALTRDIVIGGQTLSLDFKSGDNPYDFKVGNLDASIGGVIGQALGDVALSMSQGRQNLVQAEPLPGIGQTVDELIHFSPVLGVGDYVLNYLGTAAGDGRVSAQADLPEVVYGSAGVPTLRGLLDYLNRYWVPTAGLDLPWVPVGAETAHATGSATMAGELVQGAAGQFAASMVGQAFAIGNQRSLIKAVSADGKQLTLEAALQATGSVQATAVASADTAQISRIALRGVFVVGDVITLGGIAAADLRYVVTAKDLSADGKGAGGTATDAQAWANIATQLAAAVNAAGGRLVQAEAANGALTLTALQAGAAFALKADLTAATGSSASLVASRAAATGVSQVSSLALSGSFAVGDVISVSGVATGGVSYTVVAADLLSIVGGKPSLATSAQMQAAIASKLVIEINKASGAQVTAVADGSVLSLTAKAGAFIAEATLASRIDYRVLKPTGMRFSLDQSGLKLGMTGALDVQLQGLKLDFATAFAGLGVALDGSLTADASLHAAIDFDLALDWRDGLKANLDVHNLSFGGSFSSNDVVLGASLGPLALSIGKADVGGQQYQRGVLAASVDGKLSFVDGELTTIFDPAKNQLNLQLPVYASLAGLDLLGGSTTVPKISIVGGMQSGGVTVTTEHFDQFANFTKIKVEDLILALPNLLQYLETIDPSTLGLDGIPFVQDALTQALDLASGFKTNVVDKIDFYKPRVGWTAATGEITTSLASGSVDVVADSDQVVGVAGQFAASMKGQWIGVGVEMLAIAAVSDDGRSLTLTGKWSAGATQAQYQVHARPDKITTVEAFISALNRSGLLDDNAASYDIVSGEIKIPLHFAYALGLETPLDLNLGGDLLSITTSAKGVLGVDIGAGFDLIIDLTPGDGQDFSLSVDHFKVDAGLSLSVKDLEVLAKAGLLGLKAGGVGTGSGVDLHAGVSLSLDSTPKDNTTGTRFSFGQLLSSAGLSAIQIGVSGSAYAGIRGLQVLGGGASFDLGPQMELGLYVQDLGKLSAPVLVTVPDPATVAQIDRVVLGGDFQAGDLITMAGVSDSALVYTVLSSDLRVNGGAATQTQALKNLAAKLRAMVNADSGARFSALSDGEVLTLKAKAIGVVASPALTLTKLSGNSTGTLDMRQIGFDRDQAIASKTITGHEVLVVLPDVKSLFDISKLSMSDIVDALQFGLEMIDDSLQAQSFYTQSLPVINQSLQSLMDVGDTWLGALGDVLDDPEAGLDRAELLIEQALGLTPEMLDLSLDSMAHKLYIDLNLGLDYNQDLPLDFDLAALVAMAGSGLVLPAGFDKFLDASGSGSIALSVGADLQLRLGLSLPDATHSLAVGLEDYNSTTGKGTRLALTASVQAKDINLSFNVGPLQLAVEGGSIALDADGKLGTDPATDLPAALEIKLVNGQPVVDLTGAFDLRLPLTASVLGRSLRLGTLQAQTNASLGDDGLAAMVRQLAGVSQAGAPQALVVKLPDFDLASSGKSGLLQMLYDPTIVLDGIDMGLGAVQDLFQSSLTAKIPFIGSGLADAGQVISNLRGGLLQDLRVTLAGPGKPVEVIRQVMFETFGSDPTHGLHLGILQDHNADGLITIDDIDVAFYNAAGQRQVTWTPAMALPSNGVDAIRFDMSLGGTILATGIDIPLSFDIPGFALDVAGGFSLDAKWHYDFGIGLSASKGFFLGTNLDPTKPELRLDISAYLDGDPKDFSVVTPFSGSGKLLFFTAAVTDEDSDLSKPGFQGSGLVGHLNIDLKGDSAGRLSLDQLMSNPKAALSVDFGVQANLRLGVELSAFGLPKLMADFVLDWNWHLADETVAFPDISIQNLRLDMHSAVVDFLMPIANKIADVAAPFRDVVTTLTTRIDGLDIFLDQARRDLGKSSDNTLRGLIDTAYEYYRKGITNNKPAALNWAFLDAVQFALDMPNMVRTLLTAGAGLPLGSIYHLGTAQMSFVQGSSSAPTGSAGSNLLSQVASLSTMASGGSTSSATARSGLQFMPYLTDIGNWAKIFSGGSATLFTYELPLLQFSFGFNVILAKIPIPFPPLSWLSIVIGAKGSASAKIDLSFGFDSFGIQKAISSGNPLDALDGFYVNDWTLPTLLDGKFVAGTGGQEKPEALLSLSLGLYGGASAWLVSAGIGGSVTVNIAADLNDIKHGTVTRDANGQVLGVSYLGDGRIRASEVSAMMAYRGKGPLNLFDLTISATFNPYLWGEVRIPFKKFRGEISLGSISLGSWNFLAPTVQPVMGSVDVSGTLTLFAGPKAGDRLYLNTLDSAESWILSGKSTATGVVDVEFDGFYQRFTGVKKVKVDLGVGDDKLDASRLLNTVTIDALGGDGNDTILMGMAGGTATDKLGDNSLQALAASTASVTFVTGAGDDSLTGGGGNDILFGGQGSNQLSGGAGSDTLYAVLGVNKLSGGVGVDSYVFAGQLGNNSISETGSEGSALDFSGMLPASLLAAFGPLPGAPTVSIPPSFNAVRDVDSKLKFSGQPFTGDAAVSATVTLSSVDGVFVAAGANNVTVAGPDNARTFTGTVANLNAYFIAGNVSYRYVSAADARTLTVSIAQNGLTSQAQTQVSRAMVSDVSLGWTDLAANGNLLVAVASVSGSQAGVYLSSDAGLSWQAANAPAGKSYSAVAISPDGRSIAAMSASGYLAVSRDAGLTWTPSQAPADSYTDLLVLNDGRLVLTDKPTSTDVTVTTYKKTFWRTVPVNTISTVTTPGTMRMRDAVGNWVMLPGNSNWSAVTVSDDDKFLLAAAGVSSAGSAAGALFTASIGTAITGVTNNTRGAITNGDWASVDIDASGKNLVASTTDGRVFIADTTPTTPASNWTWREITPVQGKLGSSPEVTFSSDGNSLVGVASGAAGGVWLSTNKGQSWIKIAGQGEMGLASGTSCTAAWFNPQTRQVVALAAGKPIMTFNVPATSAAPNLVMPEQFAVSSQQPSNIVLTQGSLYDADNNDLASGQSTRTLSVTLAVERGVLAFNTVAATAAGLTVVRAADGLTLTINGKMSVLSTFLASSGNLSYASDNGVVKGGLTVTVSDGVNQTVRTAPLLVQAAAVQASYNGGNFEILGIGGNGLRLSRSALDDVRLTPLDDELTIARLSDSALVLTASAGADNILLNLGNSTSTDPSAVFELKLKNDAQNLANDSLTVQLKPLSKSSTQNVITLSNGQMISGVEKSTWDAGLGELVIQGDVVRLVGATAGAAIDLGDTKLRIIATSLTVDADLIVKDASKLVLNVSDSVTLQSIKLAGTGTNVSVSAALVDKTGKVKVIQSVTIAMPVGGGSVDLSQYVAPVSGGSASAGLQISPPAGVAISLGGAGTAGGLSLDPSSVSGIPALVIGSAGGSNPVAMGGAGSPPLTLSVPLVIQAQGAGGKISVAGKVTGKALVVRGPGNTTSLADGTVLTMSGDLMIDDGLRVDGGAVLSAGTAAQAGVAAVAGDLTVTGRVNGGLGTTDVLTLDAFGGDVALNGRIGSGVGVFTFAGGSLYRNAAGTALQSGSFAEVNLLGGSGSGATATFTVAGGVVTGVVIHSLGGGYKVGDVLTVARAGLEDYEGFGGGFALTVTSIAGLEGLTIAHAKDVVFGERVYMAGDVVINATGDVVFNDQVVLLNGAKLVVNGAHSVTFNNGLIYGQGAAGYGDLEINGGAVNFASGMWQGDGVSYTASGLDSTHGLLVQVNANGTGFGAIDVAGANLTVSSYIGRNDLVLAPAMTVHATNSVTMSATTGQILTQAGSTVTAPQVNLTAGKGVGSAAAPLVIAAGSLQLQSFKGDSYLREADALTAVEANVGGNLTLTSGGALNFGTSAVAGTLTVTTTSGGISQTGALVVTGASSLTAAGALGLANAGNDFKAAVSANAGGAITLKDVNALAIAELVAAGAGAVRVEAAGDISLGRLQSGSGPVAVIAGGAIRNTGNTALTNVQTSGSASVEAGTGIGGFGSARLLLSAAEVTGLNKTSGDVVLAGATGLTVGSAGVKSQADGWMVLLSGGAPVGGAKAAVTSAGPNAVVFKSGLTMIDEASLLDELAPKLVISSSKSEVMEGDTALITFSFSADPGISFVAGDISTLGGTLGPISGNGLTRRSTFSPTPGAGSASIAVAAGRFADAVGHLSAPSNTLVIGVQGAAPAPVMVTPTLTITSSQPAVKKGETLLISFNFSHDPGGSFVNGDIATAGGTLGPISGSGLTRTAIFTPTPGLPSGQASITVAAWLYDDRQGNYGAAGQAPVLKIDTLAPTLAITSSKNLLAQGTTSLINFAFSEDPGSSFVDTDVVTLGGTLGPISGSGLRRTAVFTPAPDVEGFASVKVPFGRYLDAAGNAGAAGKTPALRIDMVAPTLTIASDKDLVNRSAVISFGFSEDPGTSFALDDVVTLGGTLGALSGSGLTRTATFTVTPGQGLADISVSAGRYTDAAGNAGAAGASLLIQRDTVAPTLSITSDVALLRKGEKALITFTFSEDPGSSFGSADVVVLGGTLGAISGAGLTRKASFTPTPGLASAQASITVAAGLYADAAGNAGAAGSTPKLLIATVAPTLLITSSQAAVKIGETAVISFAFSADPGLSFVAGDVVTTGGKLGPISGSGLTRSAVFTPASELAGGGASIAVAAGRYTDAAGNAGIAGNTLEIGINAAGPKPLSAMRSIAALSLATPADVTTVAAASRQASAFGGLGLQAVQPSTLVLGRWGGNLPDLMNQFHQASTDQHEPAQLDARPGANARPTDSASTWVSDDQSEAAVGATAWASGPAREAGQTTGLGSRLKSWVGRVERWLDSQMLPSADPPAAQPWDRQEAPVRKDERSS